VRSCIITCSLWYKNTVVIILLLPLLKEGGNVFARVSCLSVCVSVPLRLSVRPLDYSKSDEPI